MEIELKPCPFCGGEADIFVGNGVRVICKRCGCCTPCLEDVYTFINNYKDNVVYKVIEKWNRRYERNE